MVVVVHSQSSALGPLVAASRPVSLLIYLCPRMGSLEPPPGAPDPFRENIPFPAARPDGTTEWDPETRHGGDVPAAPARESEGAGRAPAPDGNATDDYPLPAHPDVPTALVYAAEDELFEPAFQRFMAEELLGIQPIEVKTGHFPMVEDPVTVAELLDRLAGDLTWR